MWNIHKPTKSRWLKCPTCGTINHSTDKYLAFFYWHMKFKCSKCGKDYNALIKDCNDD